ncbi:MAG: hypothetical protein HYT36_01405 [Candidatus Staskawiczbacteria bacterium]|nr:hypothetical protein [Candidatus Staskawiczbacteria bacterium]
MNKVFLIFLISIVILSPIFYIYAQEQNESCDESNGGETGIVPCNIESKNATTFDPVCRCQLYHVFILLSNIFDFMVWNIAAPLAVFMLTIGAVMIIISGGNPNLASQGKRILWISIIGLVLVFCSWVIINFILSALGYKDIGNWFKSPF